MYEWQCRKCGKHPSSFTGNTPSPQRCRAGGDCAWTIFPDSDSNDNNWQCAHCGIRASSFVQYGGRHQPSDSSTCSATGFNHVWKRM